MDTVSNEFNVLVGNKSTSKKDAENFLVDIREKTLESLRQNPDLQEVKEGPLIDFMHEAREVLNERNKQLGIKTPEHEIKVFMANKKYFSHDLNISLVVGTALKETNAIIIWDHAINNSNDTNSLHEQELAEYNKAKVLGHELYHAVAPTNYVTEKNTIYFWRGGLHYFNRHPIKEGEKPTEISLEEGTAAIWDKSVDVVARRSFPFGAAFSDIDTKTVAEATGEKPEDINVVRYNSKTNKVESGNKIYIRSKKLINYLISNIPNFEFLIEDARINGKVGELAVAVEDVFGVGTYGELIKVVEENALKFLSRLQEKKRKK